MSDLTAELAQKAPQSPPQSTPPSPGTDSTDLPAVTEKQTPSIPAAQLPAAVDAIQLPADPRVDLETSSCASKNDALPATKLPQEPIIWGEPTSLPPPPRKRPILTKAQIARLPAEQRAAFESPAPSSSTQPSTSSSIPSISLPEAEYAKAWKKGHQRDVTFGSMDFMNSGSPLKTEYEVDSEEDSEEDPEEDLGKDLEEDPEEYLEYLEVEDDPEDDSNKGPA